MDVNVYIKDSLLKIIAKPNSPKTEIVCYDDMKKALRVNVHAAARENEANIEIIKFFRKLLKKQVELIYGFKGKEKTLKIY
jgi:uncharacterized protein (TIGR00251 family)